MSSIASDSMATHLRGMELHLPYGVTCHRIQAGR